MKMRICNQLKQLLLTLCLLNAISNAYSQTSNNYPNRPIKFIVPYAAGGGTDIFARLAAQELGKQIGQSVIVDNVVGAAGMVAGSMVAKAAPDGYTILVDQASIATNPLLYDKVPFDLKKDLEPVMLGVSLDNILVVNPSLMANNVNELVVLAKSQPGVLNYASTGIGSPQHLAMEIFKDKTGANIVHIPYKGGSPGIMATSTNEVQMFLISVSTALPFIKSGKVRALGNGGLKRSPLLPEVPAIAESLPGFQSTNWLAFFAPASTPKPIIEKLNSSLQKAFANPILMEQFKQQGMIPLGGAPSDLANTINRDMAYFGRIIKTANIRAE
ncbi:tripartite tricarboxylate transporter substrate binding protein [Polynucleobacter sp. IMCC30063]|uniref:tripartite tricarboxylate transporter substrate binding protein n=1 Tax=Polynucleobacter sp. IMCC30063 TaxID=2907298 RepID=UPI001F298D8B|nr:tripartite tricarboxylate transporter substrate binding protein [Polynucleobacter sp. IMCC30063]MCE7506565.1 tripartite tricarboxylate transporter substrate binding protein [Polynucleobacter sp. IMCC30063]